MHRRTFLKHFVYSVSVIFIATGTYKWYEIEKKPDLGYLRGKRALISEISETIIPSTDSPGAKDAKVENFIIHFVSTGLAREEQNTFINGLKEVENYTKKTFGKPFDKLSPADKLLLLKQGEENAFFTKHTFIRKAKRKIVGRGFFDILRDLTVIGYCTSEIGATRGLSYDFIPIQFLACIDLQNNQRSWATQ